MHTVLSSARVGALSPRRLPARKPAAHTGRCSCCSRTDAQKAFDRVQVEMGFKKTTVMCPACKVPVPSPLKLPGFLDKADEARRLARDNFHTPLHRVLNANPGRNAKFRSTRLRRSYF